MLLQLSQFIPLQSSPPNLPPFYSQSPQHCPCAWVLHICSLTNPFTSFNQSLLSPSSLTAVSLFHVSIPLVLFCSLVYFVHQIPLISEIICYLSFTNWLISFTIILSSSIHAVTKGRCSFCCIVFHCVNVTVF